MNGLSLLKLLAGLLITYALLCGAMYLFQGRLLYITSGPPAWTPAQHGLGYEDWTLVTSDGVNLLAWFLPAATPAGAVIVCHGNAGNIGYEIPLARLFLHMGWSVLLLEYRGYGGCAGSPSEEGTYLDAVAGFDAVRARMPDAPIVAFGESLGGAIALDLALRRKVAAVITEATFTSLPDVAARVYRWLPVRWLTRFRYDSLTKVERLTVPYLNLHSPEDSLIDYSHSQSLVRACRSPVRHVATDGGHNDGGFQQRADWIEAVRGFLEELTRAH